MKKTFGELLKAKREARGVSRRDLAARCHLTAGYLEKVERGHNAPPAAPTISDLARALKTDADELFALSGKLSPEIVRALQLSPLLVVLVREGMSWGENDLRGFLKSQGVPERKLNWASLSPEEVKLDERRDQREGISEEVRRTVFSLDNNECVYCSSPVLLEVDHIYPVSLGGTNEIENLVSCCSRCNKKKGNREQSFVRVFGRYRAEIEGEDL